MRILEIVLMIVLRLLEVCSKKPTDRDMNVDVKTRRRTNNPDQKELGQLSNTGNSGSNSDRSTKSVAVYSDEVNDVFTQVMAAHRSEQECDLQEIMRLRREVSRLQEELILAKSRMCSGNSSHLLCNDDDNEQIKHDGNEPPRR